MYVDLLADFRGEVEEGKGHFAVRAVVGVLCSWILCLCIGAGEGENGRAMGMWREMRRFSVNRELYLVNLVCHGGVTKQVWRGRVRSGLQVERKIVCPSLRSSKG